MTTSLSNAAPLIVRRIVRATPARLFDAWTRPEHLLRWFGPRSAACVGAEVDLRIGGAYRLVVEFVDGRVVTIEGTFTTIERPHVLVYTWSIAPDLTSAPVEVVTVRFEPRDASTEVTVIHDRMPSDEVRRGHAAGWEDCLDGLERFAAASDVD